MWNDKTPRFWWYGTFHTAQLKRVIEDIQSARHGNEFAGFLTAKT